VRCRIPSGADSGFSCHFASDGWMVSELQEFPTRLCKASRRIPEVVEKRALRIIIGR
jgi:hypothetical protein